MRRLVFIVPMTLNLAGCMSWWNGTIPVEDLPTELQAQAPAPLTPFQLGSLGSPVASQYRIQPGDLVEVSVSDLVDQHQNYVVPARVQEDGTIRLPLVGAVPVGSLTEPETEKVIFASYTGAGILKKPHILVSLRQARKVRVSVLGAVNKPGRYELNGNEADLLNALMAAGGLSADAGSVIDIRHRNESGIRDQGSGIRQRSRLVTPDPRSLFPDSHSLIYVVGQVKRPGVYPVSPERDIRLLDVIALAGGFADRPVDKVMVIHDAADGAGPFAMLVDARRAEQNPLDNVLVFPGDVVNVSSGVRPMAQTFVSGLGTPERLPLRQEENMIHLDLADKSDQQKLGQGIRLRDGDVIILPPQKRKPIYVIGMVNKPGEFAVPADRELRLLEAIGLAGGVDRVSLPDKVVVIRQKTDASGEVAIRVDLDKAKRDMKENMVLMAGDTISVEETPMSYVRGLLRNALHIGVGASMIPIF